MDQDSVVSSNDEPQIKLGQPRTPSSSQDNGSSADEPPITPVQPPSLYFDPLFVSIYLITVQRKYLWLGTMVPEG